MSPLISPACMSFRPVFTGGMPLCNGVTTIVTTTTTTTITTGSGWVSVRE